MLNIAVRGTDGLQPPRLPIDQVICAEVASYIEKGLAQNVENCVSESAVRYAYRSLQELSNLTLEARSMAPYSQAIEPWQQTSPGQHYRGIMDHLGYQSRPFELLSK